MTAYADIITEDRPNVLVVPNAALRFSPEEDKDREGMFGKEKTDREKKHQALRAAEERKSAPTTPTPDGSASSRHCGRPRRWTG
jgi:hypothetical protein